jgi:CRP/FNR family transcriptional regulator, cyclic AMP receptor protein
MLSACVDFAERLEDCVKAHQLQTPTLRLARGRNVYSCGDCDRSIYFIESGHIKLSAPSREGRNCLLAIYGAGDIFGETCLATASRPETATALEEARVRLIRPDHFLTLVTHNRLIEAFMTYLLVRIADYQQTIVSLVTTDAEHRLAAALQRISEQPRRQNSRDRRMEFLLSHQELSEMVGTTRSRVGYFLKKFRGLGLIEGRPREFTINGTKLAAHLNGNTNHSPCPVQEKILRSAQ